MLNPAFTGSGIGPRLAFNYRQQWVAIPGNYKQFAFTYDHPVYFLGSDQGVGISFQSDVAGEGNLTRLDVALNYAYEINLNDEHFIRIGLAGGIQQASIDFLKLRFPDQIDPRDGFIFTTQEPLPYRSVIRPDFHAGVTYYNEYAFVGLTVNHIIEPSQRFYDFPLENSEDALLPRKYTLTGGVRIPIGNYNDPDALNITPAFLLKMQGEFFQIDAGAYLTIDPMVFGLWYRHQDAVIGLVGFQKGFFRFGYSFDYTTSRLTQGISGGSHEVSVVLEFEQYRKPKFKHKKMPCPKF
jgi:type IX secretion system PorP/SprF family membrane protein